MKKPSKKTSKWAEYMDEYYKKISQKQMSVDLEKSGFKVTKKK